MLGYRAVPGHPVVVDVPRPDAVRGGRLRLVDFPPRLPRFSLHTYPLRVEELTDVLALPMVAGGTDGESRVGAAYDRDGNLIVESQRSIRRSWWNDNPAHLDELPRANAERLTGRTLFAGRISHHFGHVLLETLTRAWPEIDYRTYDQLLVYPNRVLKHEAGVSELFQKMLFVARIPSRKVRVVGTAPLVIDQLDLPTSPFHMSASADPRFLLPFDRIGQRVEIRKYAGDLSQLPTRIYLSRSRLDKRRATNEAEIESLMIERGFAVVHPQDHPLYRQVGMLRRAEVIAGCDGSALHLAVFARPGTRLLAIDTRAVENQFLIDQARELDAVHVWGATEDTANRLETWSADVPRIRAGLDLLTDDLS